MRRGGGRRRTGYREGEEDEGGEEGEEEEEEEEESVMAISPSEFASKADKIFKCKKSTQYLQWQLLVIYICNKSKNKDTSQYASTNNKTGIQQ